MYDFFPIFCFLFPFNDLNFYLALYMGDRCREVKFIDNNLHEHFSLL